MLVPFFCLNNKERQYIIYISLQACWNLAAGCGNPQSAHASTSTTTARRGQHAGPGGLFRQQVSVTHPGPHPSNLSAEDRGASFQCF